MTATNEAIDALSDELLALVVRWDPFLASAVGIPEAAALVPDSSEEETRSLIARFSAIHERLSALDPELAGFGDRLTWKMAMWQSELWQTICDTRRGEFTVSRYKAWSLPTAITSVMPKTVLRSRADAEAFLERCSALPHALAQTAQSLRVGLDAQRAPVRSLVDGVVGLLDEMFASGGPKATLGAVARESGVELSANWLDGLDRVLDGELRVAAAELRRFLAEELAPRSRGDDKPGLCWIPDGERSYQASIAEHTTTALSADEVHELGLETVRALAEEGRVHVEKAFGHSDLAAAITALRDDKGLRFERSEDILREATAAYERGAEVLHEFVRWQPETRCEVRAMHPAEASRMMQAYYRPGDVALDKPGIFWVNTDLGRGPTRYELETLVAHESVPGHHVQWSAAREFRQSRYRNLTPTTAFIEGWALYCERNAASLGLFTNPLSELGMWSSQSWRAARLVVDTGIHAKGWSRQRAVDYMLANTATSRENAEGEVDRYIGNPGQALAYMTGLLAVQQARQDAETRLGADFDLRTFHDRLLANGSPPLPLLPLIVDELEREVRERVPARAD